MLILDDVRIVFQGEDVPFTIDFTSSQIEDVTGFDSFKEINLYISTPTSIAHKIPFEELEITPTQIKGNIKSAITSAILGDLKIGIELIADLNITDSELNIRKTIDTGMVVKRFKQ